MSRLNTAFEGIKGLRREARAVLREDGRGELMRASSEAPA